MERSKEIADAKKYIKKFKEYDVIGPNVSELMASYEVLLVEARMATACMARKSHLIRRSFNTFAKLVLKELEIVRSQMTFSGHAVDSRVAQLMEMSSGIIEMNGTSETNGGPTYKPFVYRCGAPEVLLNSCRQNSSGFCKQDSQVCHYQKLL